MTHAELTQTTQFLRRVEHDGRESTEYENGWAKYHPLAEGGRGYPTLASLS